MYKGGTLQRWVDRHILIELGGKGSGNFKHKGRPGEIGGSDDDSVPNASVKSKSSSSKQTTPRRVANSLAKTFNIRMTSGAAFGGGGSKDEFTGYSSPSKQPAIEKALIGAGFEKFQHPNRREWVNSYTNGSIGVDLSRGENNSDEKLFVRIYPYDPDWKVPIHLPMD